MKKTYAIILVGFVCVLMGSYVVKADTLFTKDLYFGIQGDSEVTKLQEFLADQGVYSGPITGNFFSLTLAGVKSFQSREGITPVAGYFGPLTREKVNLILSGQVQASNAQAIAETSSTPPVPTPPATTNDINNSLQAQLNALIQQVTLLQQQLAAQQQTNQTLQQIQQQTIPTPTPPPSSPSDTIAPAITATQTANVGINSATITWTTNEYSDSAVFFGLSPGSYFSSTKGSVSAVSTGYLHTVNLSSLSADTTYYYQVVSTDSSGNKGTSGEFSFRTLPPPSGSVNVSQNFSLGTVSVFSDQTNVKIGSYSISASAASAITINSVTITVGSASSQVFQNMKVLVGGVQFGSTQGTVANGSAYSFTGTPFTINAGQSAQVDVYADILNASNIGPATTLSGCSGVGVAANNAISCNTVGGQSVAVAVPASVSIATDSATPAAKQITMGSSGNILATFRFTETSGNEDAKITVLVVSQNTVAKSGISNLGIYNSAGSLLVLSNIASPTAGGYSYSFQLATPIVVPKAGSVSLTLRGDTASYSSAGATDNSTHTFSISSGNITAVGATTNATVTVSGSASGNPITILRSKLSVLALPTGVVSGRSKSSVDDLGVLNFTADSAGGVQLGLVKITFSGSAPSSTNFFTSGSHVKLYDPATGGSYNATAPSSNSLTFDLANYQLSAGSTKSFRLRADSTSNSFTVQASGISGTLSASINAVGDISWCDAWDSTATCGLGLETFVVPIPIQSVAYAAGT